ncbi:hypothetical protein [Nocardia alni]|uniref:hypothetical protein n=1 Tax=Nocardia alni TaxID=2815723 RepID=UPI001C236DC9|nr:hypothetical protein [Nocardia alni]
MIDTTDHSGPAPSPRRHRPVLRPPREIYSNAPKDDGAQGPNRPHRAPPSRHRVTVVAAGVLAAGAVVTLVAILFSHNGNPSRSAPPTLSAHTTPTAFADGGPCRTSEAGTVVRGGEPGGTDTGPHAILGFDYAYYVLRDAAAARSFVAPTAAVGSIERLQAGITTVPAGTQHCLSITADGPGRYRVDLITRHGHDAPFTYRQIVTTATTTEGVLITAINPAS